MPIKSTRLDISVRGNGTYDGTLAVINANGLVVGQTNLSLTPEDQWVYLELDPPLSARDQTFTLASPTNEIQDQAILIRYQPQSDIYTDGHMVVKQDRTL
ncbi:hypothetical protein IH781_04210 [Patescibacteria group bacterium]|nr:hypothetical protein [Patescibacteria group bacterium]